MQAIGIIGGIVSAVGTIQQAMYQSAVAKANAKQAKLNAQHALDVAQKDAEDIGMENLGLMGELLSGQAASGLAVSSPSAIRERARMSRLSMQEQTRRMEAGNREVANFRTQANVFKAEASAHRTAGVFGAASSLIGSARSFIGSAQPTQMSPGFLPVPQVRNTVRTRFGQGGR